MSHHSCLGVCAVVQVKQEQNCFRYKRSSGYCVCYHKNKLYFDCDVLLFCLFDTKSFGRNQQTISLHNKLKDYSESLLNYIENEHHMTS